MIPNGCARPGRRIVTTARLPARAPREMAGPLVRISPDARCTAPDLLGLRRALS